MRTGPWVCPNCRIEVATPFCAGCGERPIQPQDLTLRGVLARIVHALTSIDGRVARTFWRLLRHPGTLTRAYVDGQRKPYAPPFSLFLIANVLFFAIQSLTGINVLGASLDSHLHHQDWQVLAQTLLERRLQATHTTLALYAPLFDRGVVLHAKSLVILMVLPFAGLLALVFVGRGRRFMEHLAFSLHLYAFLMLLFSCAVLVAKVDMWFGGAGLASNRVDNAVSGFNLAACGAYVYLALGPAYGSTGPARWIQALALTVAAPVVVLGYRFAIFLITLYST
ncbi:MAG: DUF3667 domain-containing protein [Caldimonas sp.]